MSFMFNPYPHEKNSAVNQPKLSAEAVKSVVSGTRNVALHLTAVFKERLKESNANNIIVGMDGYISAQGYKTIQLLNQFLET